jgi:hypothetical protein
VNGGMRATLRNVRVSNNSGTALSINTAGSTSAFGSIVAVENGSFSGNAAGVLVNAPVASNTAVLMLDHSEVSNNSGIGISATGSGRIRVGHTSITGNATGVSVGAGAFINTYGNNRNDGNGADGTFTLPALLEE